MVGYAIRLILPHETFAECANIRNVGGKWSPLGIPVPLILHLFANPANVPTLPKSVMTGAAGSAITLSPQPKL
eukprot:5987198-Heterocapsa_arctica.AAC.1